MWIDQPSCDNCSSISSRAASSADRRCGLEVRSDRMRSRCNCRPWSLRCRSRSASLPSAASVAGVLPPDFSGTSTSSFSQPRAMTRFYARADASFPLPYNRIEDARVTRLDASAPVHVETDRSVIPSTLFTGCFAAPRCRIHANAAPLHRYTGRLSRHVDRSPRPSTPVHICGHGGADPCHGHCLH